MTGDRFTGWRRIVPIAILSAVIAVMLVAALSIGMGVTSDSPPFTPAILLLLFAIGIIAGIFGGLIGVGGSTIMLPIMYFYLGFPRPVAIGTALFVVIFTSISGASGHLVRGNLDRRVAAWIAAGGLLGVLIGSRLFSFLVDHSSVLGLVLGLAFLAPSISMIREGLRPGTGPEPECIGGTPPGHLLFGTGVGILTGITGLGGGYALVPGLLYLFGAPVRVTMGTSLASMIPMAIVGGGSNSWRICRCRGRADPRSQVDRRRPGGSRDDPAVPTGDPEVHLWALLPLRCSPLHRRVLQYRPAVMGGYACHGSRLLPGGVFPVLADGLRDSGRCPDSETCTPG